MPSRRGMLTLEQLAQPVEDGSIDTVLVAFTDMQGRLQGKRCAAQLLPRRGGAARRRGVQLPARRRRRDEHGRRLRDVELGARLRRLRAPARPHDAADGAVARGDRAGAVRRGVGRRLARRRLAAADPAPPARPARRARARRGRRHRAGVHAVHRLLRRGVAEGLPRPAARQPLQRRLLDAGHRAGRAGAAAHPQRHGGRGDGGRVGQGRVQPRPARDRLPLRRRAHHLRQPLDLQDRRQGDRRPGRDGADVHGEVRRAGGQLLPHPHLAARQPTATATCSPATGRTASRRSSPTSSPVSRRACAS